MCQEPPGDGPDTPRPTALALVPSDRMIRPCHTGQLSTFFSHLTADFASTFQTLVQQYQLR